LPRTGQRGGMARAPGSATWSRASERRRFPRGSQCVLVVDARRGAQSCAAAGARAVVRPTRIYSWCSVTTTASWSRVVRQLLPGGVPSSPRGRGSRGPASHAEATGLASIPHLRLRGFVPGTILLRRRCCHRKLTRDNSVVATRGKPVPASLARRIVEVVRERGIRAAVRELGVHRDTARKYSRNASEISPLSEPLTPPGESALMRHQTPRKATQ
jgi:hypothetical protein